MRCGLTVLSPSGYQFQVCRDICCESAICRGASPVCAALMDAVADFVPTLHQKPSQAVVKRQVRESPVLARGIQHGSAVSQSVVKALAATVNRRVASSSLARGAIPNLASSVIYIT